MTISGGIFWNPFRSCVGILWFRLLEINKFVYTFFGEPYGYPAFRKMQLMFFSSAARFDDMRLARCRAVRMAFLLLLRVT